TIQPSSQTITQDFSVTFTTAVQSITFSTYQWKFNGANIPGATSTNYTIASVQASNAGNYSVAVTNGVGHVTSSNAFLTVIVTGSANDNFTNRIAVSGTNITTAGSNQ